MDMNEMLPGTRMSWYCTVVLHPVFFVLVVYTEHTVGCLSPGWLLL